MSLRTGLSLCIASAGLSCASHGDRISALDDRVAALEQQVSEPPTSPQAAPTPGESRLAEAVSVELGDSEFHGGDAIIISEVRGTRPTLELGESYVVKGYYPLSSRDTATLLLSVTTTSRAGSGVTQPASAIRVSRGDGEFALTKHLEAPGHLHLTFYGTDGRPVSGVYFGAGDWLLRHKSWRYDSPTLLPNAPENTKSPFELL